MRERGIIFQGWGVREIIEGRKTQTRRVIVPQPTNMQDERRRLSVESDARRKYPPGDLLWVRETWRFVGVDMNRHGRTHHVEDCVVEYRDETQRTIEVDWQIGEAELLRHNRWRPSIHMPRWASRLTLRITDVRVQRLQEITEEDAKAEGFSDGERRETAREHFRELWNFINGKRAPWSNNPWVWAISFEVAG